MASVMVVVAHMIDDRFFRNSVVWNRFGMNLKISRLRPMDKRA